VRSLAITFVGPVEPEVPVSFEVDVMREGKAVSQVLGRAMQKGQVVTLIQQFRRLAAFGSGGDGATGPGNETLG
jgi:acyl-CoA thioesterase